MHYVDRFFCFKSGEESKPNAARDQDAMVDKIAKIEKFPGGVPIEE
jgi:hypothetical protein